MGGRRFLIFLFFASLGFLSGQEGAPPFPLVSLLETALSGELCWRPDWPPEIPPDAFSVGGSGAADDLPREIVLEGEAGAFVLRRDEAGRLCAFPFFFRGISVQAEFEYGGPGGISARALVSGEEPWVFEFPGDLPLRGGAGSAGLPPVKASRGGAVFHVFFFEALSFLSETWYDGDGNFLAYYKAEIYRDSSTWRIRSLEERSPGGLSLEYRSFDSGGNVTEISSPEGIFTALYRLKRPLYWEQTSRAAPAADAPASADIAAGQAPASADAAGQAADTAFSFILQWDEQGFLSLMKSAGANEGLTEYRYEYEKDPRGNWIKRQALSMTAGFGLLIPGSGFSWIRRITYKESGSAGGD